MAIEDLSNGHVTINSVDLSDRVRSMELQYEAEALDVTAMGNDTRINLAGLKNWTLSVTFFQDFDANEVDATLFSLVGAAAFTVSIRRDAGATSSTNPQFSGSAILESYPPISGEVGGEHQVQATFRSAGTLARATS